ncbi:MAG: rhomboid family intramembrane serine protease [Patescibacteria group bacterium]
MIPLGDDNLARITPVVTYLLIGLNTLVFGYILYSQIFLPAGSLLTTYALVPRRISSGQGYYSFFTSLFLHADLAHLIGNMLFLHIFGDNVEDALGHIKFALFYLLCGLGGSLLQFFISSTSSVPVVGASGAIAGVMGAYLVLYPQARVRVLIPGFFFYRQVMLPAQFMLFYWILIQVLFGLSSLGINGGGVAYFSHIGGFLTGWFLVRQSFSSGS